MAIIVTEILGREVADGEYYATGQELWVWIKDGLFLNLLFHETLNEKTDEMHAG